jgi:hypothetical protein
MRDNTYEKLVDDFALDWILVESMLDKLYDIDNENVNVSEGQKTK